jgi:hypothetical protein
MSVGTFKGLNDESSLQHSLPNQMNQGILCLGEESNAPVEMA